MKKVGIVVLSYKSVKDTVECIRSLKKVETNDYCIEIYLIDNSDEEHFLTDILSLENVDHYSHIPNNGFSNGNNYGIKMALKNNCDYVVCINNDTVVEKTFLKELISSIGEDLVVVAPVIMNYFSNGIWSSGGKFRKILCDYAMTNDPIDKPRETLFATGCCLAFKAEIFDIVGFFDEDYFMYNEDVDYCYRLSKNGIKIKVIPSSIIYHKISQSTGPDSPFSLYYIYRNQMIFVRKYYKGFKRQYGLFINRFKCRIKSLLFFLKGRKKQSKALLQAIHDSKNHFGRYRY